VVVDGAVTLEAEAVRDGAVVAVPFVVVCESGGEMSGDEAEASLKTGRGVRVAVR